MVEIGDFGESKSLEKFSEIDHLKTLEAIFFVSGRFLNMQELVSISDLNPIIIRELINRLKERYSEVNSAIQIIEKGDKGKEMWKMDIKQEYYYLANRLASGSSEFSKAEKETLAIIAYKELIKQSVVIKIRGNKAYDHIKKFSELGLIKKKKTGHTYDLSLSDEFYNYFNVSGEDMKKNKGKEEN
ncbi:SMC-Scp complex subunit ScpB [Patescibacteria group bacterium]|nr:SMC-Scp complex subunit ScpB [Patescibacteria group bacterium]